MRLGAGILLTSKITAPFCQRTLKIGLNYAFNKCFKSLDLAHRQRNWENYEINVLLQSPLMLHYLAMNTKLFLLFKITGK